VKEAPDGLPLHLSQRPKMKAVRDVPISTAPHLGPTLTSKSPEWRGEDLNLRPSGYESHFDRFLWCWECGPFQLIGSSCRNNGPPNQLCRAEGFRCSKPVSFVIFVGSHLTFGEVFSSSVNGRL
jgi:hypothetical protein